MSITCLSRLVPWGLCLLVLFHSCLAQSIPPFRQQQPPRLRGQSSCQIDRITAREPNRVVKSEAGLSEFFEPFENDELECAGVELVRHTINPKGLMLPSYLNAPELVYIIRGQGIQGTVLPGCPETFETSFPSEGGKEQIFDKHQRIYRYKEGDLLVLPAGTAHWTYNDGDTDIVTIVLRDTSNVANQLDQKLRKFFLAGNPQSQQRHQGGQEQPWALPGTAPGRRQDEHWGRPGQQDEPKGSRGQQQEGGQWGSQESKWGRQEQQQSQSESNILNGFDNEILQEVFNVNYDIVSKLSGHNDNRGAIVRAVNFQVVAPEEQIEREYNGLEETVCSPKLRANIAFRSLADVYNPRGGRISTLNSYKLPVLSLVQLSAERGVLYKNAVLAPHYNLNAHSIIYVTSGSSRLQIVRNDGSSVFDDVVREGQLIVVPQDFAVLKKAGAQGCEWVAFKTNNNAVTTQLAGRFSFVRALPEEVLVNSYEISREQAKDLKYSRQEGVVLSPRSSSTIKQAKDVLLNVLFN